MRHHTKDKGDTGVGFVIADLFAKGIHVCLPISEHLPFDLVAVYPDGKMKRVSVKYRKLTEGKVQVQLRSNYSDSKGTHTTKLEKKSIDLIAIYCPDTKEVYYVDHNKFDEYISLRATASKNGQKKGINFTKDFLSP